jgi:hypothetical protein
MVGAQTLGTIAGLLFATKYRDGATSFCSGGWDVSGCGGCLGTTYRGRLPVCPSPSFRPGVRAGSEVLANQRGQAITGVMINHSADGFGGGHNLARPRPTDFCGNPDDPGLSGRVRWQKLSRRGGPGAALVLLMRSGLMLLGARGFTPGLDFGRKWESLQTR